jgi:hypothetical protein
LREYFYTDFTGQSLFGRDHTVTTADRADDGEIGIVTDVRRDLRLCREWADGETDGDADNEAETREAGCNEWRQSRFFFSNTRILRDVMSGVRCIMLSRQCICLVRRRIYFYRISIGDLHVGRVRLTGDAAILCGCVKRAGELSPELSSK